MKLTAKTAVLHAALASVALLFACSITHRSGDYACTEQKDCETGRVCMQNFCVVSGAGIDAPTGGSGHVDAPPNPHPDAGNGCPPGCSTCNTGEHTCDIECGAVGAANCNSPITCPQGWTCNIDCKTNQACRAGITCTGSVACNITCSGAGACRDITCGGGPCDVQCTGSNSCTRNILCEDSCMCDVVCSGTGDQTCAQQPDGACGTFACNDTVNGGCRSQPAQFCQGTCQ